MALKEACLANQSIEELDLGFEGTSRLFSCLVRNCAHTLKKLKLCDWCDVPAVGGLLQHSQSLKDLELSNTRLSRRDCENLVDALSANQSLRRFMLDFRSIVPDAYILVGEMIQVRHSLEYVAVKSFMEFRADSTVWNTLLTSVEK